eukprot:CAMPEP_0118719590 /NCGR_PEP_ID=MMETSP0800-20121206/29579_1 /TAXON_ID=210618 ORGANISM="Striatella unipunctata, Strain CCMP2910" /NCGR_SAMPLE_ID=MMETSP0800 /ASSEMBLY_ACC=CAM_ASM_000638 /LENGTH=268 /DNA_ID=CAMNT_0006627015 /DNA_START=1 /DNA_END=807 /DNA_ORIENTATION=+
MMSTNKLLQCLVLAVIFVTHSSAAEFDDFKNKKYMCRPHSCPGNKQSVPKVPKDKTKPWFKSTGCNDMGGGGLSFMSMDDGPSGQEPHAVCCNEWHACYQICGTTKAMCDEIFGKCAENVCSNGPPALEEQCKKTTSLSTLMVQMNTDCRPHEEAQMNACQCVSAKGASKKREEYLRTFYEQYSPETAEEKVPGLVEKVSSSTPKLSSLMRKLVSKFPKSIVLQKSKKKSMEDFINMEYKQAGKKPGKDDITLDEEDSDAEDLGTEEL